MLRLIPGIFYRYINSQRKDAQGIPPVKKKKVVLLNPISKKQKNLMVGSQMYSQKSSGQVGPGQLGLLYSDCWYLYEFKCIEFNGYNNTKEM